MSGAGLTPPCPLCDAPLVFAFMDTSGLSGQKQGDAYNTTPDSTHYLCLSCASTWKRRAGGPLTEDIVGELALLTCRHQDCGGRLEIDKADEPAEIALACDHGHRHRLVENADGLTLEER